MLADLRQKTGKFARFLVTILSVMQRIRGDSKGGNWKQEGGLVVDAGTETAQADETDYDGYYKYYAPLLAIHAVDMMHEFAVEIRYVIPHFSGL